MKRQGKKKQKTKSSDCWYTPPHIVDLVVQVLGVIDLDPCADDKKHIPAKLHYTATVDGLSQQWFEHVFMNPPYSCPGDWMAKLQSEVQSGRVKQAIALVPASTDTRWLSPVLKTQPVCFWKGRIKFLNVNYQSKLPARQSHVLVYWGENRQKFKEVFENYGVVYLQNPPSTQLSDGTQVLEKNLLPSTSPSTYVQGDDQVLKESLLLSISPNTLVSNEHEVLWENQSLLNTPSTQVQDEGESLDESLLSIISTDTNLSNDNQVLGEIESNELSPSTHRKHGNGSGNISWGYANANSTKKKPIKQLYFEWDYGGVRGKTYVRSHLRSQVIALNQAKEPVTEILKLLTYNPKVALIFGIN